MSWVDTVREQIETEIGGCELALDAASAKFPPLVRWVIDNYIYTKLLPEFERRRIADGLIAVFERYVAGSIKMLEHYRNMARSLGSPDNLRALGDVFKENVGGKESALSDEYKEESLTSLLPSNWSDEDASVVYGGAMRDQKDSIVLIGDTATALDGILDSLATAIESFYQNLLIAVIGAVVAILGCVSAIMGIVEAAAAAPTVVGSIPGLGAAIIGGITAQIGLDAAGVSLYFAFQNEAQALKDIVHDMPGKIATWKKPSFATSG